LKNLKTILEISRYQNKIETSVSEKTQNPTSLHEKRGLRIHVTASPMVGVNGLCWKLKGEYQEPADLSRIYGQKHMPVPGIGYPQFHTVTKGDNSEKNTGLNVGRYCAVCIGGDPMALCGLREIRGRGHFSHLRLFLCAERKFVATDLRLPLKPRRASAPNHPIIRYVAGLDSEFDRLAPRARSAAVRQNARPSGRGQGELYKNVYYFPYREAPPFRAGKLHRKI
jgi:hypothetical protein